MYQSSSESSVELESFPSVINLYAETPAQFPTKRNTCNTVNPSQSLYEQRTASTSQNDPFLSLNLDRNYQRTQFKEDEGSYASSSTYGTSPTVLVGSIPPMQPISTPVVPSNSFLAPKDRRGSCGSPQSSDSDSDTPLQNRRESTSSTSTSSSDDDAQEHNQRPRTQGGSWCRQAKPQTTGLRGQIFAHPRPPIGRRLQLLQPSLSNRMQQPPQTPLNIVGSPSPSSNNSACSGSGGRRALICHLSGLGNHGGSDTAATAALAGAPDEGIQLHSRAATAGDSGSL
uniref:Uncharacterized protein n=1 Tax=Macrostomum lignano TaxID=282301 RepID=A0A1I8GAX8_9PLAT